MENEEQQRRGKDGGINRTCPLKFSTVFAREKKVNPDAVHWLSKFLLEQRGEGRRGEGRGGLS